MKCDPRQNGVTIPSLIRTNPGTITQKSEKCGRQIQQSGLREPSLVWQMRDQKPKQRWVNKGSAPPLSSPCHQKRSMGEKQKKRKSNEKHDASLLLYLLNVKYSDSPIAQGEISMSVAFPTHVWKMPNICKHIIVWLFSHMCAFSHTYVSKSKHVWKIAPRCKYTNVFGFFQTCWIKVKHLPKLTCVVFYTQVWLFSNIFAKSQTCVEKTIMFH